MRTNEQLYKDLKGLTEWVNKLRKAAEEDDKLSYSVYKSEVGDEPFVIVGGWEDGFNESYADQLYISKTNPTYAMSIKIVINDGPWAYADFETLTMPIGKDGEIDDTCIALERCDVSKAVAAFYLNELERILKEHEGK